MSVHVVFVCLGNICRSPSAQGVLEKLIVEAGLENSITVDSCGTAAFNVGKNPDPRAVAACQRKGYDISQQIARQINDDDYSKADYVIAMDSINLMSVKAWAPKGYQGTLSLFMRFAGGGEHAQIPDPYYQEADKFDGVISVLEKACAGLLDNIQETHMN